MVKSVHVYSDEAVPEKYSRRVHIFGMLTGILQPRTYRTVEVDFICDLLKAMMVDVKSIDEKLNSPDAKWERSQLTEVLLKQFEVFNMPPPGQRGQNSESVEDHFAKLDDGSGQLPIDEVLFVACREWRAAMQWKESQLLAAFRVYDKDGDGQFDLKEFTSMVNDIDGAQTYSILPGGFCLESREEICKSVKIGCFDIRQVVRPKEWKQFRPSTKCGRRPSLYACIMRPASLKTMMMTLFRRIHSWRYATSSRLALAFIQ